MTSSTPAETREYRLARGRNANADTAFITMVTGVLIIVVVMFFPGGFAQMVVSLRSYFKKKSVERRLREYGKD